LSIGAPPRIEVASSLVIRVHGSTAASDDELPELMGWPVLLDADDDDDDADDVELGVDELDDPQAAAIRQSMAASVRL
jgi:hypothetical protein